MTRIRIVTLGILALVIAGVCIRLGMWQLDRLDQRRAENARIAAGLMGNAVELEDVGNDSTRSRALRVRLHGQYDFDHEIVLINRSREGAPGVNLLTPLRVVGKDTAVLVNRGWVYSPDGATVDPTRWREPADARGTAYVSWLASHEGPDSPPATDGSAIASERKISRAERASIARLVPYPVRPYQLILLDSGATVVAASDEASRAAPLGTGAAIDQTRPVRLPLPALDEGPHRSYAIQWFSFAAIALIGTGAVVRKEWSRG